MKTAIYVDSFDPFTNGHLHVIKQAAEIFDEVQIVISINSDKQKKYLEEDMKLAIYKVLKREGYDNVNVYLWERLISDYTKVNRIPYLIRGLRNGTDYEYEENIAKINEELGGLKTIYFRAGIWDILAHHLLEKF